MHKYFAAANTADGFVSWFDDIFSHGAVDYTYIIKGGCGTGKSTLMRATAQVLEKEGGEVEYFYCSSDPTSLDGIIVSTVSGKKIAMLDGTAPHAHDPKYPGVCDEIINLGNYWDKKILEKSHDKIIALSKKKSKLFSEAYKDFSAAGTITKSIISDVMDYADIDKLNKAAIRLLTKRIHEIKFKPHANRGTIRIRGLSALSTIGKVSFDSFFNSDEIYVVTDTMTGTPLAFEAFIGAANLLGISYDRAPMPLLPEYTEALRFGELSLSIVSNSFSRQLPPINMSRFIDKSSLSHSERKFYREMTKCASSLVTSGLSKLSLIKTVHGELESIYGSSMNFPKLSEDSKTIISEIAG